MAYIILYTYIWCLPKKFPNTCFIWKANGGSKFSQCAEISWIKIRMCLEVCQLLPPICYKKSLLVKKEPVDTSTKLWTRSRWGSNFPKLFRIDGKKNMKKTNSLALKYPKVVASFYIQTFHPEKTLLDKKKNGDWNIHPHENRQLQLGKPPSRWVGELRCEDRHPPMDHHQRLRFDSGRPGGAKGVNAGQWKA